MFLCEKRDCKSEGQAGRKSFPGGLDGEPWEASKAPGILDKVCLPLLEMAGLSFLPVGSV